MSAYINIYTTSLTDDIIPTFLKQLKKYEHVLEIGPAFSFKRQNGNLSVLFKWHRPSLEIFNQNTLKVEFAVSLKSFELKEYKKQLLKNRIVAQGLIKKILYFKKKKKKRVSKPVRISEKVESELQHCSQVFSLKYHPGDVFENQFATLSCAIITELCNGICHFTQEDIWYDSDTVLKESISKLYEPGEIEQYARKSGNTTQHKAP